MPTSRKRRGEGRQSVHAGRVLAVIRLLLFKPDNASEQQASPIEGHERTERGAGKILSKLTTWGMRTQGGGEVENSAPLSLSLSLCVAFRPPSFSRQ